MDFRYPKIWKSIAWTGFKVAVVDKLWKYRISVAAVEKLVADLDSGIIKKFSFCLVLTREKHNFRLTVFWRWLRCLVPASWTPAGPSTGTWRCRGSTTCGLWHSSGTPADSTVHPQLWTRTGCLTEEEMWRRRWQLWAEQTKLMVSWDTNRQ